MIRAAGAAVLSALLLWLAAPPIGIGWLAWVALVPVAAIVLAQPGARAARIAVPVAYALYLELLLVLALPFGIAEGQWGDPALPVLVGDSPVLVVALIAIPLFAAVLYAIRFGEPWGLDVLPPRLGPAGAVLVPALAWTAFDFLRVNLDPGGFWGPLFLSQADGEPGRIAALAGPWAVTFAIVAVNYGIALALVRRRAAPAIVSIAAVLIAAVATPEPKLEGGGLTVAALQPGYDTAEDDRPELRFFEPGTYDLAALDLVRDLGGLSREAAREGAEVIVWPEASMYVDPRRERSVANAVRKLAHQTRAVLVIPFFLPDPDRSQVLAVVPGAGSARFAAVRPKQRPMWFLGEHAREAAPEPLSAGRVTLGALLGVDTQDAEVGATLADRGASLLVSSTHDWRELSFQHREFARLAARSSGVPLVRADWRHGSAIFAPDGGILADAGTGLRRTVLVADVPAPDATTYQDVGNLAGWIAVLGAAVAWIAQAVGRRRASAPSRAGAPASGGRGPRPGWPPRRPSPAPPRATGGRSRPRP